MTIEELLKNIFATLPIITINGKDSKPNFDFGSHEDLLKYIDHKNKQGVAKYPLVWLETPVSFKGDTQGEIALKLVLATVSNSELSNTERLQVTFKTTLDPLLVNVKKALQRSGATRITDKKNNVRTNHFNYGVKELGSKKEKQATVDIWDAIKFECKVIVNEMCDCDFNINY